MEHNVNYLARGDRASKRTNANMDEIEKEGERFVRETAENSVSRVCLQY